MCNSGAGLVGESTISNRKIYRQIEIYEVKNGFTIQIHGSEYAQHIAKTIEEALEIAKNHFANDTE